MSLSSLLRVLPARLACASGVVLLVACGGGDSSPTENPPPANQVVTSISAHTGVDGQTAPARGAVPVAPAVVVRDQNGQPIRGVSVTFSVAAGGGSVSGATATTDAGGVARAGAWTLGPELGANTLVATASGGQNPSAQIAATARLPRWTFMVYLAADNNLAIPGLQDLEEIESIITNADVQVVVQAEFNPDQFAMQGLSPAALGLPNYDTFRFVTRPDLPGRLGPDGPVVNVGNRNMTDPAQLRDFVAWSKENHPAERYALVLWNHGGGFTGLIEDVTSSGSRLMSLGELPAALEGVGTIDVLNFDMCLMGSYETLQVLDGLARVAVFSQELEPGDGDPYDLVLGALAANPSMDARELGRQMVEKYHASYSGSRASITKSAYDMQAFATFDALLGELAATLSASIPTHGAAMREAVAASQKYEYPFFTDLGDFLDSLRVRTTDATLRARVDAVLTQARSDGFRIANRTRNGTANDARPVDRSTGIHVTLPGGTYPDVLPDAGPGALAAYQALFPGRPWTAFLTEWVSSGTTAGFHDQGAETRFEAYLVWEEEAADREVDVDLMILEPNGNIYVPFLGTVTPNGHLTGDSFDHGTWYEGYLTNRWVETGRYQLYALLFSDPQDYQPAYDVQYRFDQRDGLESMYPANPPTLSTETSWLDDPEFSLERLDAGLYTDFQLAAWTDIGVEGAVARRGATGRSGAMPSFRVERPSASRGGRPGARADAPRITAEQAETLRRAVRDRRASGGASAARQRAGAGTPSAGRLAPSVVPRLRAGAAGGR